MFSRACRRRGRVKSSSCFRISGSRFNHARRDARTHTDEHENREVIWQIAARRSTYSRLNKHSRLYKAKRKIEYCKAQTRAKIVHPIVSGDQAPVWLCESALSRADEKHCSTDHAVCFVEPVDGSKTADGYGRLTRVTRGARLKSPTKQCRRAFLR